MNETRFRKLHQEGFISDASMEKIDSFRKNPVISVFVELRTGLALAILLLTTGLGILIYKNLDNIGHSVIVAFIALLTAGGFIYCYRNKLPFKAEQVPSPGIFFDYTLLLACLCAVVLTGYLQYQYNLFGNRWGLAGFIPMVILLWSAYYFDHQGVLSIGITAFAAWCGIVITPERLLLQHDFSSNRLILTGIGLGILCVLAARLSAIRNWKKHFQSAYLQFGVHFIGISCVAGLFQDDRFYFLWIAVLIGCSFYLYVLAIKSKSFPLILFLTLYCYVALSDFMLRFLIIGKGNGTGDSDLYLVSFYFIVSAIGLIAFFVRINRKLKHDRLQ
jgi:hypothetical protein